MAGDVRILVRAPILYSLEDGGTTHAPLVVALVAGIETRCVLDTGSDGHLLTREHAELAGLNLEPGEEGTDHSGTVMPSWSVEDVALELGGTELTLRNVVSIPAPAPFRDGGIGGLLSPQHLHPSATTVIDLVEDELLLVDGDELAVKGFLASRRDGATTLALERVPGFTTVVVPVAVQGYEKVPTILNTGGKRTEFARAVVPGLTIGAPESLGAGVSGADVVGASAGMQALVVSGHQVPVAALAVREAVPDPPGLVGMDVLRGTVLACAASLDRRVLWQV